METELAIALSARSWSEGLHRFLADHGGARVRLTATGPDDLLAESFDVLLIDDICSFLTPRLIDSVKQSGRAVVGVYEPREFADGKDRLLECGVTDVVDASAHPDEFVAVIDRVVDGVARRPQLDSEGPGSPSVPVSSGRSLDQVLVVSGPPGGTGATEVTVTLAASLAARGASVVIVDGDDSAPSIAQRLGLPLHPNIRTAIDVLEHRTGILADLPLPVAAGVVALPGLPNVRDWSEVRPRQVRDVVLELRRAARYVVVDVGSQIESIGFGEGAARHGITHELLGIADRAIAVGLGSPVGLARLLDWVVAAAHHTSGRPLDVLINRAPRDAFRRNELIEEFTRTYRPASLAFLPEDAGLAAAVWNGDVPARGRFARSVSRWASRFVAGEAVA